VFVGSYTRSTSKGIHAWRFLPSENKITSLGLVGGPTVDPTWLILHPHLPVLYASNELTSYQGNPSGSVTAYGVNGATGQMTELSRVASAGMNPSHLIIHPSRRWLVVSNYGSATDTPGTIAIFEIASDGGLSATPHQVITLTGSSVGPHQQAAHPHSSIFSPDGNFLFVQNLGADTIVQYQWDSLKGFLSPNTPADVKVHHAGAGPRHAAFSRNGRFLFVNNELDSTITSYTYSRASGTLQPIRTVSTVDKDFRGENTSAELAIHPNGKFIYVSNRGEESVVVFSVDQNHGTLQVVGRIPTGGAFPRSFQIDREGKYLFVCNQHSDSITIFRINPASGGLTPTGLTLDTPTPCCPVFFRSA